MDLNPTQINSLQQKLAHLLLFNELELKLEENERLIEIDTMIDEFIRKCKVLINANEIFSKIRKSEEMILATESNRNKKNKKSNKKANDYFQIIETHYRIISQSFLDSRELLDSAENNLSSGSFAKIFSRVFDIEIPPDAEFSSVDFNHFKWKYNSITEALNGIKQPDVVIVNDNTKTITPVDAKIGSYMNPNQVSSDNFYLFFEKSTLLSKLISCFIFENIDYSSVSLKSNKNKRSKFAMLFDEELYLNNPNKEIFLREKEKNYSILDGYFIKFAYFLNFKDVLRREARNFFCKQDYNIEYFLMNDILVDEPLSQEDEPYNLVHKIDGVAREKWNEELNNTPFLKEKMKKAEEAVSSSERSRLKEELYDEYTSAILGKLFHQNRESTFWRVCRSCFFRL